MGIWDIKSSRVWKKKEVFFFYPIDFLVIFRNLENPEIMRCISTFVFFLEILTVQYCFQIFVNENETFSTQRILHLKRTSINVHTGITKGLLWYLDFRGIFWKKHGVLRLTLLSFFKYFRNIFISWKKYLNNT